METLTDVANESGRCQKGMSGVLAFLLQALPLPLGHFPDLQDMIPRTKDGGTVGRSPGPYGFMEPSRHPQTFSFWTKGVLGK